MAVTLRYGNNYRVLVGKETALGSGKTNATSIDISTVAAEVIWLPDKVDFLYEPAQIDTGAKTQVGLSTVCEMKAGYKMYNVKMSGYLSHEHIMLIKAFTADSSSPYQTTGVPTLDGYVIERVWSEDVADPYAVDKAIGCQLQQLTITGTSGDMVRYEALWLAQSFTRETTQAVTGTDPGANCTKGFNFGDVTATLNFGDTTHLKSFSITLNNELADDSAQFQNSNTRLAAIPIKVTGDLNYVTNYYYTATDKAGESKVYDSTALVEIINLINTTATWAITMNTQVTSYVLADPDKSLFDNNVTSRLVYNATGPVYPISIAVS